MVFDDVSADRSSRNQRGSGIAESRPASSAKRIAPRHLGKKDSDFSTPKKRTKTDGGVTENEDRLYVPTYIHKNVSYFRKGEAKLSAKTETCFRLVAEHFVIPKDMEQSRKYGPLSGTSFEERVISAYNLGLLEPKRPESDGVEICSNCAEEGHTRDDCPKLI